MCKEKEIILTLIRNGKTLSNEEERYAGRNDELLSENGIKELEEYKKICRYPKVNMVFTSKTKRCKMTAEILYPEKEIQEISEWNEINFGIFEGKTYEELKEIKEYQDWIDSNGSLPFPEGESREAFVERCNAGMQKMINKIPEDVRAVAVIGHSGTIMALLSSFCGGKYYDYMVSNGSGFQVRVVIEEDRWKVEGMKRI